MRAALFFSLALSASWAAPIYQVVELGAPGMLVTSATAVNQSGVTVGTGTSFVGLQSGIVWDGGSASRTGAYSTAEDINASGAVAGTTWRPNGPHASVWRGGAATVIPGESYGLGINDAGQMVGGIVRSGHLRAFVADGSTVTTIATPGSWSAAYDISNTGYVAGTFLSGGAFQAFRWGPNGLVYVGSGLGGDTYGMAVNDAGSVVGSVSSGGYLHAFLFDALSGTSSDLGTLGGRSSSAYDINSSGHIVGYSYDDNRRQRAFVWAGGTMFDLNALIDPASGWSLEAAYGINERGQIVGAGTHNGLSRGFLLDLTGQLPLPGGEQSDDPGAATPEPGTWVLFAGGMAIIGAVRAFRRVV